jgi:hypothetical protein
MWSKTSLATGQTGMVVFYVGIAKIPTFSKTVIPVIPRTPIKIPVNTG